MNTQLKQRLLGAIIIVALIVIFVPMLFSKHEQNGAEMIKDAPPPPQEPVMMVSGSHTMPVEQEHVALETTDAVQDGASEAPHHVASDMQKHAEMTAVAQHTEVQKPPETATAEVAHQITKTTSVAPVAAKPVAAVPHAPQVATKPVAAVPHTPPVTIENQTATPQLAQETDSVVEISPKHGVQVVDAEPVSGTVRDSDAQSANVATPEEQQRIANAKMRNQAWVVQLGSFSEESHAEKLIQKLRAHHFTAFSYNIRHDNALITKVYVGPVVSHADAEKMRIRIANELKAKGFVSQFNALDLAES